MNTRFRPIEATVGTEVDYFQYLPEAILGLIVSFLPFLEAARTSVLSKRWRYVWLSTTNIELNENFFTEEFSGQNRVSKLGFISFSSWFLYNFQGGDVKKFRLCMSNPNEFRFYVEYWLMIAISKHVQVLDLDFSMVDTPRDRATRNSSAYFELPEFLYRNTSLQVLRLSSCIIRPLDPIEFDQIQSLYLEQVRLDRNSLKVLLSGCRALENLSLKKCRGLESIEISSPFNMRLRSLTIHDCSPLNGGLRICAPNLLCFKYFGEFPFFDLDVCSVVEAELDFGHEFDFIELGDLLQELLHSLFNVKVLTLCSYTTQVLPSGEEPTHMRGLLGNVDHLILKTGLQKEEVPGIALLLRSCHYLQFLTIEMGYTRQLNDYVSPYEPICGGKSFWSIQMVQPMECLKSSLKSVVVNNFTATEYGTNMLRFLLEEAKFLHRMVIVLSKEVKPDMHMIIFSFFKQCRTASPNVRVMIYT